MQHQIPFLTNLFGRHVFQRNKARCYQLQSSYRRNKMKLSKTGTIHQELPKRDFMEMTYLGFQEGISAKVFLFNIS